MMKNISKEDQSLIWGVVFVVLFFLGCALIETDKDDAWNIDRLQIEAASLIGDGVEEAAEAVLENVQPVEDSHGDDNPQVQ